MSLPDALPLFFPDCVGSSEIGDVVGPMLTLSDVRFILLSDVVSRLKCDLCRTHWLHARAWSTDILRCVEQGKLDA